MSQPYTQRPNTGSLFRNDRKTKETHPDYQGRVLIDGVEYYQSAWLRVSKSGKKYFSMVYTPVNASPIETTNRTMEVADDDVPF